MVALSCLFIFSSIPSGILGGMIVPSSGVKGSPTHNFNARVASSGKFLMIYHV